jgi:pyridoxal phosphate enzyme (YggS family)
MDARARVDAVRARIADAAQRCGRAPGDVTLVAVSKLQPTDAIAAVYAAGCRDFGENYVQELAAKHAALAGVAWHFIGHLQRNKVAPLLASEPVLIHGVDSRRLLAEIDKRASKPARVLLHVNIAGEDTKSGCAPSEVEALVDAATGMRNVVLRGLMTIPPAEDAEAARPHFRALRELAERLGRDRLPELSMGMSADYEVAIEEGATIVRVGTAIFGARPHPTPATAG